MIWKTIILLSCALCVFGDGHYADSKQRIKINQREQTGEIVQTGAQPEHHDGYAWSYPAYEFSYEVHDPHTHDKKGQEEKRDGDEVRGEYWLVQPDGRKRTVTYDADNHKGFNAIVHYSKRHHHEENIGNRNQGNRNEGNQRQEERGEQENSGEVREEGGNEQQQRAPERENESQRQGTGRRNEQQRQGPGRGIEQQRQGPGRGIEQQRQGLGRGNEQQRQGPGRGNEQQRQGPGRGNEQQRQGPGRGIEQQRQGPGRGNEQQRQGPGRGNEQQRQGPGRGNEELRQGPNRGNVELRQGPVRGNEQEQRAPVRGNEQQQGAPVREIEEIEEGGYEGQGESLEEIQRGEITRWGYGPRWEEKPTRIQETGRNNQEQPRENSDARVGEGPRNANNYRQQEIDVMSILNNAGNSGLIRGNQREVQQRWYNEERRLEENNEETGEAEGNRRAPEQRNFDERRAVPSLETPYYGRPAIHPRFLNQNSRRN